MLLAGGVENSCESSASCDCDAPALHSDTGIIFTGNIVETCLAKA